MVYQGATGDIIKAMVDQGAKGIVIASAGAGATSGTQGEGIQYALDKGVFVVDEHAHRLRPDRRAARAEPPRRRRQTTKAAQRRPRTGQRRRIAAEDLAPVKARILLMLALTRTSGRRRDPADVHRVLNGRVNNLQRHEDDRVEEIPTPFRAGPHQTR